MITEIMTTIISGLQVSGGTYEHMACMAGSEEGLFLGFARRVRKELLMLLIQY